jgi:hypothetical protein
MPQSIESVNSAQRSYLNIKTQRTDMGPRSAIVGKAMMSDLFQIDYIKSEDTPRPPPPRALRETSSLYNKKKKSYLQRGATSKHKHLSKEDKRSVLDALSSIFGEASFLINNEGGAEIKTNTEKSKVNLSLDKEHVMHRAFSRSPGHNRRKPFFKNGATEKQNDEKVTIVSNEKEAAEKEAASENTEKAKDVDAGSHEGDSSVDEDEPKDQFPTLTSSSSWLEKGESLPSRGLNRDTRLTLQNISGEGGEDTTVAAPRRDRLTRRNSLTLMKKTDPKKEGSIRDISASLVVMKQLMTKRSVRFSDEIETKEISPLPNSAIENLFYASEDFANFRYEAFMEACGLDPNEYD